MLSLYVIMALAVIGIGAGVAHLADPHDGGVRGVWTADENYCDADGCVWLGTFIASGGIGVRDVGILDDEPTHLTVGASFRAYFHDDGSDGQWVEIPHRISGWWLLGPGVLVLIGAVLVWWRRGTRSATRGRLDLGHAASGGRPIPVAYDLLTTLIAFAVAAGLTELIELCWPGHGWHYGRLWLLPMAIVGRVLLERMRVRRYGPDRVAAARAYDRNRRSRRDRRLWGWTLLLSVGWAAVAFAVLFVSIGINVVLTDDFAEAWSCAAAVVVTVALAVGVAALTARVVRRRRAVEPIAVSDVEQMSSGGARA